MQSYVIVRSRQPGDVMKIKRIAASAVTIVGGINVALIIKAFIEECRKKKKNHR